MTIYLYQTLNGFLRYRRGRVGSSYEQEESLRAKIYIFAVTICTQIPAPEFLTTSLHLTARVFPLSRTHNREAEAKSQLGQEYEHRLRASVNSN